jgi:probable addiction module antidote protein
MQFHGSTDGNKEFCQRVVHPEYSAAYLNVHLMDENRVSRESFLLALRDVTTAFGMTVVAERTKLGRETLYRTLSKSGNPRIGTLVAILGTMGLRLVVEPKGFKRPGPQRSDACQ